MPSLATWSRARPAYVPRRGMGPRDAIEASSARRGHRGAGARAVGAAASRCAHRRGCSGWGLGGLEVYYPGWDDATVRAVLAASPIGRGLLATGGSDYHGDRGDYASAQAAPARPAGGRDCAAGGPGRGMSPRAQPAGPRHRRHPRRPAPGPAPGRRTASRSSPPRSGAAALPRLDAGLPDERLGLGGDGGRAAGGRLRRGRLARGGRPHRHQHLLHPRGGGAEGHRPDGRPWGGSRRPTRASASCSPAARCGPTTRRRLARRYPAVDLFLRPDEEPELVGRLGLAGPDHARERSAATGRSSASAARVAATADRLPADRAAAVEEGRIARAAGARAWLPIIYGCDKTCTYCIVPFARGPERSRPFDDILAEAAALAAAGCPGGHAARPERQLLGPRPAARPALRGRRRRAHAGSPPGPRRPAGHRRAAARHRRPARRRRRRPRASRACAS